MNPGVADQPADAALLFLASLGNGDARTAESLLSVDLKNAIAASHRCDCEQALAQIAEDDTASAERSAMRQLDAHQRETEREATIVLTRSSANVRWRLGMGRHEHGWRVASIEPPFLMFMG